MAARLLLNAMPLLGLLSPTRSLDNGVALRPYMGYNTWYDFECNHINASNVMKLADTLVSRGLDKLGYTYLNLDDCWQVSRDNTTRAILPDAAGFPDGMKSLADYVHSKGLKFGVYTDRGTATCAGRPGSQGFEDVDARVYAAWGVDLLKEDSCNAPDDHEVAFAQYGKMRDALNRTGRPIVFNLCGWNSWYAPVGATLGNSWRIGGDGNSWEAVVQNALINAGLAAYAGPGAWNDPDFLLGSSPRAQIYLTPTQSRMQFSLWAVMSAPLILSSSLLDLSQFDFETYTNAAVIEVDQDALGLQGTVVWGNCPKPLLQQGRRTSKGTALKLRAPTSVPACQQIWAKRLFNGDHAMAFVNFAESNATAVCDASCFEQMGYRGGARPKTITDLWQHGLRLDPVGDALRVPLGPSGGFALYRLSAPGARAAAPVVV